MITLPTLYSLATNGKIKTLTVEIHTDSYRTITGYLDGIKTTSAFKTCKAKSYCTASEQASKEAHAFYSKKIAMDWFDSIDDIQIKTFFSPMLAKDWEDEKDKVKYPILSNPKLDGVRCLISINGMFSRNGKKIISAPHIFESLLPIFDEHPTLILDGELYCDKLADDFNKIISCVRKTKPTSDDLVESEKYIEYWIYDYIDSNFMYSHRCKALQSIYNVNECKYIKLVPVFELQNEQEVNDKFEEYISQGFEGQILRIPNSFYECKRSKNLLKHKSFKTDEFIILSVNEGIGKLSNKAGTMSFKTKEGVLFESAINGSHEFLEDLWNKRDELINKEATVRYFNSTSDGSLRFPKVVDINRWEFE
jgi:DNA ligase-1